MTFLLPADLNPDAAQALERSCVANGQDGMPWPTTVQVDDGRLILRRTVDESGFLIAPWEVPGSGRVMGTSATLMERERPYHFLVELARGKVNQLRSQSWEWRQNGLLVPQELDDRIREASHAFGRAITGSPDGGTVDQARQALTLGYQTSEQLVRLYRDQVFQVRHQRLAKLDTALGFRLDRAVLGPACGDEVVAASNHVTVPFPWHAVEPAEGTFDWSLPDELLDWAFGHGIAVSAGPLIDFSSSQLPDWLWHWEHDLANLLKFMGNYVTAALKRYRRRIRTWQLTAASNSASLLSLSEEELLWLTVKLTEVARQTEPGVQLTVGISQPWGEYMALEDRSHSPFIFADTLLRSPLNLTALDLEIVMGVLPRGSYCRDLLEVSRLLDLYALLGVPLRVTLGYPSASACDYKADPDFRVTAGTWRGGYTPDTQAEWAAEVAALAVCKPYVQSVQWVHASDAAPHQFPHCGLFTAAAPKPALNSFRQIRMQHLR